MLAKYIKAIFTFRSAKKQLILYLVVVAVIFAIKERGLTFLGALALAVFVAVLIEALFLYFKTRVARITESSIITGMIIGYVLSSDEAWWKLVFAAMLAIFSKHIIVLKKKHIFNPAGFGILLVTVIFGASTQWAGTYMWYVLVPAGVYFVHKIRKAEVIVGYAIVSLALFGTQAFLQKAPPMDMFGYFSFFYIFVMLIEPKTTPTATIAKYIFGAVVAALIFVLTEVGGRFDVELASLLLMNSAVPLLNKIRPNKGGIL